MKHILEYKEHNVYDYHDLGEAIFYNQFDKVKELVDSGINLNVHLHHEIYLHDPGYWVEENMTPLLYASAFVDDNRFNSDIVQLLLEHNQDKLMLDKCIASMIKTFSNTTEHNIEQEKILRMLMANGGDPSAYNNVFIKDLCDHNKYILLDIVMKDSRVNIFDSRSILEYDVPDKYKIKLYGHRQYDVSAFDIAIKVNKDKDSVYARARGPYKCLNVMMQDKRVFDKLFDEDSIPNFHDIPDDAKMYYAQGLGLDSVDELESALNIIS